MPKLTKSELLELLAKEDEAEEAAEKEIGKVTDTCNVCNGSGLQTVDIHDSPKSMMFTTEACPACKGDGKIERDKFWLTDKD